MVRRLESLGDRLLGLVVPKVRAGACYCYINWSACAPTTHCRKCYHCSGGPSWCGSCTWSPCYC